MIEALTRVGDAVGPCADAPVWALGEDELIGSLQAVHALEQRVAAVKLGLLREIDGRGLPTAQGASSTAVWLRERLRISGRSARRLVELAAAVDAGPAVVRDALTRGAIGVEQSQVIVDAVAAIPATAGAGVADKAAQLLVDWAGQFEPSILRRLGERIPTHVAPDLADQAQLEALQTATARAASRRHVTLSDQPDGHVRLTGSLDTETAALLRAALDPLSAPAGVGDDRTPGQRRAYSPGHCAAPSPSATAAAPSPAATDPHAGATATTSSTGPTADPPPCTTRFSSAGITTASSTTRTGP